MSPNVEEGKIECEKFFPEDYAETLDEEDMNFENISIKSVTSGKEVEEQTQEELVTEDENVQEVGNGEGNMDSNNENPEKDIVNVVSPADE